MFPWQKYFLHPLTALIMALSAYHFVDHYALLDFRGAPHAVFVVIFLAYLLLAKKYDPSLSVIFFLIALFAGYKAYKIPEHAPNQAVTEEKIAQKLGILAAVIEYQAISTDDLPEKLSDFFLSDTLINRNEARYCIAPHCDNLLTSLGISGRSPKRFAIVYNDHTGHTWFVDDALVVEKIKGLSK